MTTQQDSLRKLIELSIAAFRKKRSEQTGFIHLFYHAKEETADVAIPLVENFLYAWTLLRSRTVENIAEAKNLLERLRHFVQGGNFPVYLHEFPECKDRMVGIQIGAILQALLPPFQQVLGQELRDQLTELCKILTAHAWKIHQERPLPFTYALRLACTAKALGLTGADAFLETLRLNDGRSAWTSPAAMGEMLAALYSVYPSLHHSPWRAFWDHIQETWHRPTCSYVGPGLQEFQVGFEPQVTLYDLYLGMLAGQFSKRVFMEGPHLYQVAWVLPNEDMLREKNELPYAYALVPRKKGWNPATDRSFHPLKLVWGTPERLHTLVCQGGNCESSSWSAHDEQMELIFDLGTPPNSEDRENAREVCFFLDFAEEHRWVFAGQRSTTFKIEDEIILEHPQLKLSLRFKVLEGEGQWMGHLMRGNRPAQLALKGAARYNAYDWQLFLRAVHRTGPCRLQATLTLLP